MTITVELTEQEISLLRAGLAAHSLALLEVRGTAHRERVRQQREDCRDLSIRLGDLQIAASA